MKEKTIFISSGKCNWAKCLACGWGRIACEKKSVHDLKKFFDKKLDTDADRIKIFVSGSFLDDNQFPRGIRKYVARKMQGRELVVESRPEFITDETLSDFKGVKLLVAIGLECADDKILKKYNKGFTLYDYTKAADTLHKNNFKVRTYLMIGLPWKIDYNKSISFTEKYSDEIVLINTFPHYLSPLYQMWLQGKWKPLDKKEFEKIVSNFKHEKEFNNFSF